VGARLEPGSVKYDPGMLRRFPEIRWRLRLLLKRLNIFDRTRPVDLDEGGRVGDRFDKDGYGSHGV
jgi:hypothetical protein